MSMRDERYVLSQDRSEDDVKFELTEICFQRER
jgi:hypothetical protein